MHIYMRHIAEFGTLFSPEYFKLAIHKILTVRNKSSLPISLGNAQ